MKYHDITKDDMLNGDGLRVVLWVSGCSHKCPQCQNPITWDPYYGLEFNESAKQEIFNELDKDYISGITLSGGDPLHNLNFDTILELCKEIKDKYPNKTIWLYTGYTWESVSKHMTIILPYIDVLVDGTFKVDKKDLKLMWKGSSNQRVIDVQASLNKTNIMDCVLYCSDL